MSVPEHHRALAHEFVDGAEIEERGLLSGRWYPQDFPSFCEDIEYRRKPKAKVKKWRWVAGHPCGLVYVVNVVGKAYGDHSNFFSETEALRLGYLQKIDVTMIEVGE